MNKVLNKDIKSPGDTKFARWQALFNNFDFSVEHIKGTDNSIPDFLSREHLQNLCLIISVQLRNGTEILVNIPDSLNWETYESEWRPHWELRSTKILSQTTQLAYSNLVPEVRFNYPSYKALWWNFIQQEEFLTLVKFGNVNTATSGRPPLWLADWQ
jgi:hypothetical protein